MISRRWILSAVLILGGLLTPVPGAEAGKPPILVFAADSIADVLEEIGAAFTKHAGTPVRINAGDSTELAQQIYRGAPADVFISAGGVPLAQLKQVGLVDQDSTFMWATNQLVVIAPAKRAVPLSTPEEIAGKRVKRLAIGDPQRVPAGDYARQALTFMGLWDRLKDRLVVGNDVHATITYVESGEVDLGIVYLTDARRSQRVKIVYEFGEEFHDPIRYPVSLVASASRASATVAFLEFLRSPESRRILVDRGFSPAFP